MRLTKVALLTGLALLVSAAMASAQSTTGTLNGRVVDGHGLALPGVSVTAESPNLQGSRTTTTSETGDYVLTLLPSGSYTVRFELSGFQIVQKGTNLAPTQVLPVDATLGPAQISETVEVVGRSADVAVRTAQVATNFKQGLVGTLPTNRDINASIQLAPSVHPTGPLGAYSIGGSMGFENLFMVNGVSVTDNLRGQPYDLYIEDAIQETTIATAGISAEYGRFGGGVVNVITKSGGNLFSGSFRDTLLNDRWRTLTPFEQTSIAADANHKDTRVSSTVPTYEYTFGGPVAQDRLWFFTAGRYQQQEAGRALIVTLVPYTFTSTQQRYEAKGTYSVRPGHRFQASFIGSGEEQVNQVRPDAMDANSLYTARHPMNLFMANYEGVLSPHFLFEARYSGRNETLEGTGAKSTDPVNGTLLIDRSARRYWSATFCGICDPEQRDGQDIFLKGSYFLSRKGLGSHNLVFGYDGYNDRRWANNHQSGSDYRIIGTGSIIQGGNITAQFLSDGATRIQWNPILLGSEGTNFRTHSLFYSDNWRVSNRVTANLGVRYDRNHGVDSAGNLVANDGAWSPRFGVIVDPKGDGAWSVTGSVARYVDAVANTIANAASAGGNPDTYQFAYRGPDINKNTAGPLTPTADGIRQVFDWFNANGGASMPLVGITSVNGVTPVMGDSLSSPSVWEYAGGVNRQFGSKAAARADMVYRQYHDFYGVRTDTTTGTVKDTRPNALPSVSGRTYDLSVIENTDIPERQYAGLTLQGQYRWTQLLDLGASYTVSRTWGNVDGENPGGPSAFGALQYPEYKAASWNYPVGDLSVDQRHRARIWASYGIKAVRGLTVSALEVLESGVPYGAVSAAGVNPQPYVTNPGYITPPDGSVTMYYFSARDAFRTEGQKRTDVAASYVHKLKYGRNVELFGQLQVINLFNQYQLCACGAATVFQDGGFINMTRIDQTVRTSVTNPATYQTFNPFTTAPTKGVNWDLGPNFGKALSRYAYTSPRTLRLTFGVRF